MRAADVGKRGQCKKCGEVFRLVGEKSKSSSQDAKTQAEGGAAATGAQPPAAAVVNAPPKPKPQPTTVTFPCELCETRITAHVANVGKAVKCPDCGRRNVIPPPVAVAVPKTPGGDERGAVRFVGRRRGARAGRPAAQTPMLHPVECGLCQTLMYATDAQVGKKLKCPDCGTLTWPTRGRREAAGAGDRAGRG